MCVCGQCFDSFGSVNIGDSHCETTMIESVVVLCGRFLFIFLFASICVVVIISITI